MNYIKYKSFDNNNEDHYNLSLEELNEKYGKDIKNNRITQDIYNEIINTLLEYTNTIESIIKYRIKRIFISIISIKYLDENGQKDIGKVYELIENINFLLYNELISFNGLLKTKYYNIESLCNIVYNELKDTIYGKYIPDTAEEDFNYKNLLDINYHLTNFKKYGVNDKEFINFINNFIGG